MTVLSAILLLAAAVQPQRTLPPGAAPEARQVMADYARCVAKRSPDGVHQLLTQDFTSTRYRDRLLSLWDDHRSCYRVQTTVRATGLPFAAALAEARLLGSTVPLNVRLLKAAAQEVATYTPSDKVAMCVARSDADGTAALLTSTPGSAAEKKAAADMGVAAERCASRGLRVDLEPYGLRAVLATASYRLLAAAGDLK